MRRWEIGDRLWPTQQAVYAPTLEQMRRLVPLGCVNLRRQPADKPQIVETWI